MRAPDVLYDGLSLPFRNNSVDVVIAIDVLEHIPHGHKSAVVSEICRVATKRALLVFPFDSANNRLFEDRLAAQLDMHGIPHRPSFDEHRELGLVKIADIEFFLGMLGYPYEVSYHSPLEILVPYHDGQIEILAAYGGCYG